MKKRLIIPALIICVLASAACGSEKEEQADTDGDIVVDADEIFGPNADYDSGSDEGLAILSNGGDDDIKRSTTVFADAYIEETELYNADGITVTAVGFDAGADLGPEVTVRVVNESEAIVDVIAEDVAVNGYMLDPGLLYIVAGPGETVDDALMLYGTYLDARGIDTVAEISLNIAVKDDASYTDIGKGDRITLVTSAGEDYAQEADDSGDVIYDKDGIRVISRGLIEDSSWDGYLVLYVENNTDMHIMISSSNVSVNGIPEEYTMFFADLYADTRTVGGMYLMDIEDQEIRSIDDVEEVSLQITISDQELGEQIDESDEITLRFD